MAEGKERFAARVGFTRPRGAGGEPLPKPTYWLGEASNSEARKPTAEARKFEKFREAIFFVEVEVVNDKKKKTKREKCMFFGRAASVLFVGVPSFVRKRRQKRENREK